MAIAVFSRAPLPGTTKTRLIPALGAAAAARLQRRLTLRTLAVAQQAAIGSVRVWAAPDERQRFFRALHRRCGVDLRPQPAGDLGERMAAAFADASGPLLLIGCDCPVLQPVHLVAAAAALRDDAGNDAVFIPAEDGGYVLVGLRRPQPSLFAGIDWGSERVMAQTRHRLAGAGLSWLELPPLWDVDRPGDLMRLAGFAGFHEFAGFAAWSGGTADGAATGMADGAGAAASGL
ncbi:MAG TPA: TIGR04282 family arsenosugar biosynthesis glycosyltransferase [Candidatus Accumulibacter phosphatis]|nr:MAG: transferase 1, rSAM/selenodomain-associated [Candidatus Accumulibacter sp. SK-11]HRL76338.1 TIGR04282 family arsenosugar biosynthesis glycosyltransferase [Candidatus Accumulibacter phosphatis]HRQ94799.1 TIGR04282 family arsenosugar biosynthesis glycosyltransferase [Candidatus Accumulibacter phosphatis]